MKTPLTFRMVSPVFLPACLSNALWSTVRHPRAKSKKIYCVLSGAFIREVLAYRRWRPNEFLIVIPKQIEASEEIDCLGGLEALLTGVVASVRVRRVETREYLLQRRDEAWGGSFEKVLGIEKMRSKICLLDRRNAGGDVGKMLVAWVCLEITLLAIVGKNLGWDG